MMRILLLTLALAGSAARAQYDLDEQLRRIQSQQERLLEQQRAGIARLDSVKLAIIRRDLAAKGLPALKAGEEVITHPGHMLVYDERHEQARWVAHIAVPDLIAGNLARIDSFMPDPLVKTGTAVTADYWNSGFDRGHLVPSADMRWNIDALRATYLYSNVCPQRPELNRGTWAELEDWVRRYVNHSKRRVFVVTGPVLRDGLPVMQNPGRRNEVSIPEHIYKVVADLDSDSPKAIGFVMSNGKQEYPPISYAVSVDSVERLTGLDFFQALPDAVEDRIEAMRAPKDWLSSKAAFGSRVSLPRARSRCTSRRSRSLSRTCPSASSCPRRLSSSSMRGRRR